jgi:hypothetical protein
VGQGDAAKALTVRDTGIFRQLVPWIKRQPGALQCEEHDVGIWIVIVGRPTQSVAIKGQRPRKIAHAQ